MLISRFSFSLSFFIVYVLLGCTPKVSIVPDTHEKLPLTQKSLPEVIESGNLILADELYLQYRGEHPDAKQLPNYILLLSEAHMKSKEYLLARYYAEAYISDFPTGKYVDKAWFLRIKSLYLRYRENDGSQTLVDQLKTEVDRFLSQYEKSHYRDEIERFKEESQKRIQLKNKEIAKVYERMGKDKAAAYYRSK